MIRAIDASAHDNSWGRRPLEPVVLCLSLVVLSTLMPSPATLGAVVLVCLVSWWAAGVRWRGPLAHARIPLLFALLGVAPLCVSWSPGWSLPVLDRAGFAQASEVLWRSWGCLAALFLLAWTVPVARLCDLASRMRVPRSILDLVLVVHRFLLLLDDSLASLLRARRARGVRRGTAATVGSADQIAAALLRASLLRSERQGLARRARRGTGGFLPSGEPLDVRPARLVLLGCGVVLLGLLLWKAGVRGG